MKDFRASRCHYLATRLRLCLFYEVWNGVAKARKRSTPLIIILGYVERAKEASFEAGPRLLCPEFQGLGLQFGESRARGE